MNIEPIGYEIDMWAVIVPLAFVALDVVTGLAKAVAKRELDSTKMRDGLFHKGAFVLAIVLAILCEVSMRHMDLGFSVPLLASVSAYVVLTELTSILENLAELNPELGGSRLMSIFHSSKSDASGASDGKAA